MPVMMQRAEVRRPDSDFDEPLLAVYVSSESVRGGLQGSEFWREEIRLEVAKDAFHRGTGLVPWRRVEFDLQDRGIEYLEFREHEESDDDLSW
ncbi:hypothetical protein [Intrasporangium sp. DVR]|uniref:hypothetical protein n=1 Tax=Intrasporangium sp. DVR TaxID=3127867 RepID=UPI00313A517B